MTNLHAFKYIDMISHQCYIQPRAVAQLMRRCFLATIKYNNKLWTKTLLERLLSRCIGTNDVVKFAFSQVQMSKKIYDFYDVIKQNMERKLFHAAQNEKASKFDMIQCKIELKIL